MTSAHRLRRASWLVVVLAAAALATSCGLDKEPNPDLVGPSDAGVSVDLLASPDTLNADGVSQSVVRLVLRDAKGSPIANKSVLFDWDGDGRLVPQAGSTYVGPIQTGLVMATDRDGTTSVVYVAGTRYGTVTVFVRPYGIDASLTEWYRIVRIIQR